jgi:hypothetical protein
MAFRSYSVDETVHRDVKIEANKEQVVSDLPWRRPQSKNRERTSATN